MNQKILSIILVMVFFAFSANAQKPNTLAEKSKNSVDIDNSVNVNKVTTPWVKQKGVLLDESFETWPATGWGLFTLGDPSTFTQTAAQAHSGTYSAYHNDDNVTTGCDNWLVSPGISITDATTELSFWQYQNYGTFYNFHEVVILDGPDPSTATVLDQLLTGAGTEDTWTEHIFSLSAYVGQTIYIGFHYEGDWADEWYIDDVVVETPPDNDLAAVGISPLTFIESVPVNIFVTVENAGVLDQNSYDVSIDITDASTGVSVHSNTLSFTENIAFGDTYDCDMGTWTPVTGTYSITATVVLVGDENPANDEYSVEVTPETPLAVPYTQDFENAGLYPAGWSTDGFEDWEMTEEIGHGASTGYGGSGYYAGLDDSNFPDDDGEESNLITPFFDLSGLSDPYLSFYYQNMDDGAAGSGDPISELHVEVTTDGTNWIELLVITQEVDQWTKFNVMLTDYYTETVKFRFRGITTSDYKSDPSVDNFVIENLPDNDLGVTDISPNFVYENETYYPEISITNYGAVTQNSYAVTIFNNTGTYSETANTTTSVATGETITVNPPEWNSVPTGTYTLTAIVSLTGDEVPSNDTLSIDFRAFDFENYTIGDIYAFDVSDWTSSGFGNHFVNVDTSDATMSDVGNSGVSGMYAGDFVRGMLVGMIDSNAYGISTEGYALELDTLSGLPAGTIVSGLTWDVENDEIFVSTTTDLYKVDETSMALVLLGTYTSTTSMIGIASDVAGNLYGISLDDNLYSIDKTTGAETLIGPLGIDIDFAQDIGFDRVNNILYGTLYLGGGTGGLYTIDVATGTATQVGTNFGDELSVCAMFFNTYSVTYSVESGDGTITATDDGDSFDSGSMVDYTSEVIFTATPDAGWKIADWYVDGSAIGSTDPTYTIASLDADVDVTVEFTEITYTVTFSVEDGDGTIEATADGVDISSGDMVADGSEVIFTATPDAGWEVADWYVDGSPQTYTETTYTIDSLEAAVDVTVEFSEVSAIKDIVNSIEIYPNPSTGVFNISVEKAYSLKIMDVSGKTIYTEKLNSDVNQVDISENQPGMYIINLSNKDESINYKVILK